MDTLLHHLDNPIALTGFGVLVLAIVLKPIFSNAHGKLSGKATERLLAKSINFLFILAVLVIVVGVVINLKSDLQTPATEQSKSPSSSEANNAVSQETTDFQSPAINSGGDVNVNYGGVLSNEAKARKVPSSDKPKVSSNVQQITIGKQSPAINSTGDVSINYGK